MTQRYRRVVATQTSKGKAERYGRPFIELIKEYIEINEIEKPGDLVVRQLANKSKSKVSRKPLPMASFK